MSTSFTLDSAPHAPRTVVSRKGSPDLYLLLDPETPNWVIVNTIGKDIITLCDGKTPLQHIIQALCEKYNEPYHESVDSVLAFVNELREKTVLREEEWVPPSTPDKKAVPLHNFWLNVTNACNLRCIHCHQESGPPLENELTEKEICHVISEAQELGARHMTVSGGEPLLRKDILAILAYAYDCMEGIQLITNGTQITDEIARVLKELNVAVQVSLDGAREETQDFIRGKGSYRKVIEGLKTLVRVGAPVTVGMTLMSQNVHEMEEMAHLVKSLGISSLHFPILQMKGRAKQNESQVALEDNDLIEAFKRMKDISKIGIVTTIEDTLRNEVEKMQRREFCGAGISMMSVSPNGNIYPCAGLHDDRFCGGTIREQTLKDIWETGEVFSELRSLSVLDIPECGECELKYICGGGCHVDRFHDSGELKKVSPKCGVHRELYWYLLMEEAREAQHAHNNSHE
ncbi:MAG: radical SAM protein [Theionarchaea archaeon]|nr:radical SAM protein [Theionarchaea archaeon]